MGATVTDPLIGTIVDERYKVVSRIARGGMATVYLAVDRRLDREVALKVMHAHLADGASGATFVSRFRREARSAARLTHPGLVGVLDQGVDGETSYLVMEYIDGPTLRHRLLSDGAVELGTALSYASEILDALAAAHRAGLVHRDIKPENVLITKDGHVKVADFGLARAVTEVTSTTTGTVMGTVGYLAPELVSRGISDARTDVYSVGVMLYEMVTGHQPFTGDTPIQVALQHVTTDLPAPSEREPWLPIEVDELVSALAARDPQHRPSDGASAHALVQRTMANLDPEVLERRSEAEPATPVQFTSTVTSGPLLTGEAATEVYDQLADPADKAEVDSSAAATTRIERPAGSTVALPIGVGVELAEAGDPPTGTVVAPTPPSRHRRRRWLLAALWVLIAGAAIGGGIWWYQTSGPGAFTTVPSVVGKDSATAKDLLTRAGLTIDPTEAYDHSIAVDQVISSEPEPGSRIRKDGTVTIVISLGQDLVTVPDGIVGATGAEAEAALKAADLVAVYAPGQNSDTVPTGSVISADYAAGDSIERRGKVTLTLSQGPAPVSIPTVTGSTPETAEATLTNAGLKYARGDDAFSDTVPAGQVISQSPAAGTGGHRMDTVTVVVSKGKEMIEVPDLFGKAYDDAAQTLTALGFDVKRENMYGGLVGIVRFQSVPAGGTAPRGATITLTVF